jgi:hypothetical protein
METKTFEATKEFKQKLNAIKYNIRDLDRTVNAEDIIKELKNKK